jgi:phage terminase large subunit-like protein
MTGSAAPTRSCSSPTSRAAAAGSGLDLAEKRDFAAKVLVFPPEGDLEAWAVFVRLYLNEAAVLESGNAHLEGWARAGYVTVTDGNATDFDVIADDMREDARRFDLQEIDYDPAMSRYFATKLAEEGLPMVEIRQAPMFFTQPLIQIETSCSSASCGTTATR